MRSRARRVKRVHFVGIGGAGMSGIAEVLHNQGLQVSGSDQRDSSVIQRLRGLGIEVSIGHSGAQLEGCDVVVTSTAIAADNPEVLAARAERIPVVPRAEMLAELMRLHTGIAIAGTHGKTTTTSLVASLLAEGDFDPTFVIGGRLNSAGAHARLGTGEYLVAEADESDASFLYLHPVMAVVTNIDADHMDTYGGDLEQLRGAFSEFLHHLPFHGLAVLCLDDPGVARLLPEITKPVITYGIDSAADFRASGISYHQGFSEFTVSRPGHDDWLQVRLRLPGRHNVLNALAAIAIAREVGVEDEAIIRALEKFEGIGRRFQTLGTLQRQDGDVLLIDDYAHHPTEIAAVVEAARNGWSERRLVVVFEPHRYSRTRDLFGQFLTVLQQPDLLFLLPVYGAGEQPLRGYDSAGLANAIAATGGAAPRLIDRDELPAVLSEALRGGDLVLTLGAGSIGATAATLVPQITGVVP
ncbi:MAG: UDP-N-acetylmuramate--L-alanine ligase [Gammaproteobacteria bacterium]|nr:UDP-N-acetylmuramate--L-alanine ligase [Gammaproteobacteria bacterium]